MSQEPLRLLLLDGHPGWTASLRSLVENQGLQLIACSHPEEAQQRLMPAEDSDPVDVVVVDLGIGTLARQRFARWVEAHRLSLPILAVGPQLDEPSRVQLLESWADDVLPQPLSMPEFAARCRALWRRQQLRLAQEQARNPLTRLCHAELTMLVMEHEVRLAGRPVDLTPREFRLLEFFLRHPGQILDRDTLLEQVWGECSSFELDPKTVDVHIRWLRIKLEADPASPTLITTVRGRGYRLG